MNLPKIHNPPTAEQLAEYRAQTRPTRKKKKTRTWKRKGRRRS